MLEQERLEQALDLCTHAGGIMLRNGAETMRIEETIMRLGYACGAQVVHSFVIPTGIFISVQADGHEKTGMIRVSSTSAINLYKVHEVNDLSRKFERQQVSIEQVRARLDQLDREPYYYRLRYQHLACAVSSGAFAILFGGSWAEFFLGAICGWLANTTLESIASRVPRFLAMFFAAFVGVVVAVLGVKFKLATQVEPAIIGAVIPLVPGVSLTNAVRDLMAGDLLSGVARAGDALLTAFAIAAAVALVLSFHLQGVDVL